MCAWLPRPPGHKVDLAYLPKYIAFLITTLPFWSLSGGTDGWMECSEWLDQSYCILSDDVGFLLVRLVECELPPIIYICV